MRRIAFAKSAGASRRSLSVASLRMQNWILRRNQWNTLDARISPKTMCSGDCISYLLKSNNDSNGMRLPLDPNFYGIAIETLKGRFVMPHAENFWRIISPGSVADFPSIRFPIRFMINLETQ